MKVRFNIPAFFSFISHKKYYIFSVLIISLLGYVGYRFASDNDVFAAKRWAGDGVVVTTAVGDQYLTDQSVAVGDEESSFVAWVDTNNDDSIVKVQKYDKDGNNLWDVNGVTVCPECTSFQYQPMITRDGSEGVYVVWKENKTRCNNPFGVSSCGDVTDEVTCLESNETVDYENFFDCEWDVNTEVCSASLDSCTYYSDALYVQRLDLNGDPLWSSGGIAVTDAIDGSIGNLAISTTPDNYLTFAVNISGVGSMQTVRTDGSLVFDIGGETLANGLDIEEAFIEGDHIYYAWNDWSLGYLYVQKKNVLDGSDIWTSGGVKVYDGMGENIGLSSNGGGGLFVVFNQSYNDSDEYEYGLQAHISAQGVDMLGNLIFENEDKHSGKYSTCPGNYVSSCNEGSPSQLTCESRYTEGFYEGTYYECSWSPISGCNRNLNLLCLGDEGGSNSCFSEESSCSTESVVCSNTNEVEGCWDIYDEGTCNGSYENSGEGYYDCGWGDDGYGGGECYSVGSSCRPPDMEECNPDSPEGTCGDIVDEGECEVSHYYDSESSSYYNCYWQEESSGGGDPIYYPVILDLNYDYEGIDPKVTYASENSLVAAWTVDTGLGSTQYVRYQKVGSNGLVVWENPREYSNIFSGWTSSALEGLVPSLGGFMLLVREYENPAVAYSTDLYDLAYNEDDLAVQLYNHIGDPLWSDSINRTVTDQLNGQGVSTVISNGFGGMITAWHDYRHFDPDTDPYEGSVNLYAQQITPAGKIINLSSGIRAAKVTDVEDDLTEGEHVGFITVAMRGSSGDGRFFAEVLAGFNQDLDWSNLSGGSSDSKSFLHYDDPSCSPNCDISDLPGGAMSTYVLYVPIPEGRASGSVHVCPNATDLEGVTLDCLNGETFTHGETKTLNGDSEYEVTATKVTFSGDNKEYWKIDGVKGTGGISISDEFALRDTLTRLEVGQPSNHTIEFGTINGTGSNSADTIVITFDPVTQAWDLTSIVADDIDMSAGGSDLTLCTGQVQTCSAGNGIWGIAIDDVANTITFSAPTDGVGAIGASTSVMVLVGDNASYQSVGVNQIVNPSIVEDYEVHMKNTYNSGSGGVETGEVEIPIIDDDTVNIHGYIDTLLTFDIDTATTDVDCDAAGGASPCNSHGGVTDGSGYVVSLGEMTLETVNKGGDSVLHADGLSGLINYVWFDLETNANSGAVVTIMSENGSLYKDASNYISSVLGGAERQIVAGSGLYGVNHRSGFVNTTTVGSLIVQEYCDASSGNDYYCSVGTGAGIPLPIFESLAPVNGRMQFSVGATPNGNMGTGTYTDRLTFIATAVF